MIMEWNVSVCRTVWVFFGNGTSSLLTTNVLLLHSSRHSRRTKLGKPLFQYCHAEGYTLSAFASFFSVITKPNTHEKAPLLTKANGDWKAGFEELRWFTSYFSKLMTEGPSKQPCLPPNSDIVPTHNAAWEFRTNCILHGWTGVKA